MLTRHLWSSSFSSCCHARACESQKRIVIRMSRREHDDIEAGASSIDRDDERLKRDEMRHSGEVPRWVCMGLVCLFQEVQDFFGRSLSPCMEQKFFISAHLASVAAS